MDWSEFIEFNYNNLMANIACFENMKKGALRRQIQILIENNTRKQMMVEAQKPSTEKSINEETETNEISIYPNPATNEFQVTSSKFKVKSVNIYNVMGEEIWSFDKLRMTENESYTIDVSSYAKGVYFVEVQTDGSAGSPQGSVLRKKLIKE